MGPAGFLGGSIIATAVYVVASSSFGEQKEILDVDESSTLPGVDLNSTSETTSTEEKTRELVGSD